jgi:ubiquitin-protein ligase
MSANKKILKEISTIINEENKMGELINNDYVISYDESNVKKIKVIFKAPYTSEIYRHKFFRLDIYIDNDYPFIAPKVNFLNYTNSRIHPILYEDGRTCMTILNTWYSDNEKWSSSISIHALIQTFISFITDDPYVHEPGGKGNESYSRYVEYQTWDTCFYQYIIEETDEKFIEYIHQYIYKYNLDILSTMTNLNQKILNDISYNTELYDYTECYEIDFYFTEMPYLIDYYKMYYQRYVLNRNIPLSTINQQVMSHSDNTLCCLICLNELTPITSILLSCNHHFHIECLKNQIEKTLITQKEKVCGMCRQLIQIKQKNGKVKKYEESIDIICNFEINPITKRFKRKRE